MTEPLGKHVAPRPDRSGKWDDLYRKALRLAEKSGDPRRELLRDRSEERERVLRSLSIVSDEDLLREFQT